MQGVYLFTEWNSMLYNSLSKQLCLAAEDHNTVGDCSIILGYIHCEQDV